MLIPLKIGSIQETPPNIINKVLCMLDNGFSYSDIIIAMRLYSGEL